MPLSDHLHRKSDPIRAFLDERLIDFFPAREEWRAAQSGGALVPASASYTWNLVGWAIDYRIRLMVAPVEVRDTYAWRHFHAVHDVYATTMPAVAAELDDLRARYGATLGVLAADDETHLLQICWVLAVYDSIARGPRYERDNTLFASLRPGAKWRAHINRLSDGDVDILRTLVAPARNIFPILSDQRIVAGPVFSDSLLVGGADGDLIVNDNLIEIKCEAPGFRAGVIRQVIAYALLDASNEFELTRCGVYFARFGTLAVWNLESLVREVSQGRYGLERLRQEFHSWLVAQEEGQRKQADDAAESRRRFAVQWEALDAAASGYLNRPLGDHDAQVATLAKLLLASREVRRLEAEAGLDTYRQNSG